MAMILNELFLVNLNKMYKIFGKLIFFIKLKNHRVKKLNDFFKNNDIVVMNGPFSAMKYPSLYSNCSSIFPKIIGSYESELEPTFKYLFEKSFSTIIDIGSAEGYYAIGLGLRFPNSTVYAFEMNQKAQNNCKKMGKLNNVKNVIYEGKFDPYYLNKYQFNNSLVICDIEGAEKEIFTSSNIINFINSWLIIEVHDFIHHNLSKIISENFQNTHNVIKIKSSSDLYKIFNYKFHKPEKFYFLTKKFLYSEYRPNKLCWLFIEPKANKE